MMMKFILLSNLLVVSAYNIDTNYPILYPNSATNVDQYLHTAFQHSYFGFSVLLHRDVRTNTSWLFIGVPRGNYSRPVTLKKPLNEPGVVFQCSLPGSCVEITPVIKDQTIYIRMLKMYALINKKHSWFGSAMSIERSSGFFTICAPRTIVSIVLPNKTYIDTMQGMCYSDRIFSTMLQAEVAEIEHFDYSKHIWSDPMYGFSVAFAPSQGKEAISRIVGRPNDNIYGSINVAHFKRQNFLQIYRQSVELSTAHDQSMFGYAVTSGYYFDPNQSLYACADPGWNYVGQVAIIDSYPTSLVTRLHGSDMDEFFGASLATGDLNKDSLHDLVVGAPHWGNDNGRVYIYLGSPRKEFEVAAILEGTSEDAQFGYAVASGDLDGDGFSDIIVSAPWEESGVIYIYNGDASLKDKIKPVVSQRITTQLLGHNILKDVDVQTFGFSISEPIDVDNNGHADIAVGAYKSGHVLVLRSRPVVKTNLTVYTVPSTLQRNVSKFFIEACVDYHGYDMAYVEPRIHAFKISLVVDKRYKRTKNTSLELFSTDPPSHCVNTSVVLTDNIQDFIEPIAIYATHDFSHNDSSAHEFCETCPVESRSSKLKSAQVLLPFDIGCGEDRVCSSNISATMKFLGVRENDSWVIGSNDITLEAHLENHAEPAYLMTIMFTFPDGIVLRSILPSCEENTDGNILMILCNVGNPLGTDEQKVMKLDLDMRHLTNGSLHGHVLEFPMEIRTRSVNHGTNMIKSPLTLLSEASLLLNGKAAEEHYYLSNLDEGQLNVTFQHTYQIWKFGATPLERAQLIVNIPAAMNDSNSVVSLYKPRIYISGEYYDCLSTGIDLIDRQQDEAALDAHNPNSKDETLQNMVHNMAKRDISSRTTIAARILQMLYNNRTLYLGDSETYNLTARESDIVYLNCSTHGVNCSMVYCDLSALKTQQDIGKLVMRLILNATKLKGTFGSSEETKIVKFSTNAYVQIVQPANRISNVDTRCNMNLTTEFHSTKREKLQLWVVLVSISLGLILLCIVIIVLSMVGFFRRTMKEELRPLKTDEITEDGSTMKIMNTSEDEDTS